MMALDIWASSVGKFWSLEFWGDSYTFGKSWLLPDTDLFFLNGLETKTDSGYPDHTVRNTTSNACHKIQLCTQTVYNFLIAFETIRNQE